MKFTSLLAAAFFAFAFTIACGAGKSQVRDLDNRVAKLEKTQAKGTLEQRVSDLETAVKAVQQAVAGLVSKLNTESATASVDDELEQLTMQLDDMKAELDRLGARAPAPPRPGRPDPNEVYAVPVDGSPFRGARSAKVTIIRGFEFACPYCERSRQTMDQLLADYRRDLRVVYKFFIVHPHTATIPAMAACAAARQKKFAAMETAIWERGFRAGRDLSEANMERIAGDIGLDMRKFKRDMKGEKCRKRITDDQALLSRVGVRGTPSFFINGRPLTGAQPIDRFKTIIDEELEKANKAIRSGIKKRNYYKHVVKNGKTSVQ